MLGAGCGGFGAHRKSLASALKPQFLLTAFQLLHSEHQINFTGVEEHEGLLKTGFDGVISSFFLALIVYLLSSLCLSLTLFLKIYIKSSGNFKNSIKNCC